MQAFIRPLLVVVSLTSAGCQAPDTSAIEVVLGTAAPLGFIAARAMGAIDGESFACATVAVPCDVFPCTTDVDVDVSETCPLPIGDGLTGSVRASGVWADARTAVLAIDVSAIEALRFEGALGLIVDVDDDDVVDVIWAMEGVEIDDEDDVDVDQGALTIRVDRGDLTTLDDDVIEVNGAQQVVRGEEITQVTVTGTRFTSACTANPIAGEAVLQKVDGENNSAEVVGLAFHETCDGRADPLVDVEVPFVDTSVALALTD